jgi:tRNA-specific 2-thiouridylase
MAKELGLKVHNKPESQEICFVPDGDYHKFLRKRLAQEARPGPIVDTRGKILGDHQGIMFYTIGQRRGLGIAKGFPLYVIAIDKDKNEIMVGEKEATYQSEFIASGMNWISDDRIEFPLKVKVKIRYNHKGEDATVFPLPHGKVKVRFKRPQPAITPGQAAAFYRDDVVVGGGWIDEVRN